jgi:hypothetical protein
MSFYASGDYASHTVTYWHARITISTPVPDESGAWYVEHFHCPHSHTENGAAEVCAAKAERYAERHHRAPGTWHYGPAPSPR